MKKSIYGLVLFLMIPVFAMQPPQLQPMVLTPAQATQQLLNLFNWEWVWQQQNTLPYEQWANTVNMLIAAGAQVNRIDNQGRTPLIRLSQMELVKKLQNRTIVIATDAQAQNATAAIAQILINVGADIDRINNNGETALLFAVRNGNVVLAETLIRAGAVYDPFSIMAIIMARGIPLQSQIALLNLLLSKDFNINSQDANGNTLLHVATKVNSNPRVIQYLLDEGANPLIRNNQGATPLDLALQFARQFPQISWPIIEILQKNMHPYRIP